MKYKVIQTRNNNNSIYATVAEMPNIIKSLCIFIIIIFLLLPARHDQAYGQELKVTSGFTIPVALGEETTIKNIDITIAGYDTDVIELTGVTLTGGILENNDYGLVDNTADDQIHIVIYARGEPITGKGNFVFLNFDIKDEGKSTTLSFTKFESGEAPADGGFNVNGSSLQSIEKILINYSPVLDDSQTPTLTPVDEDNFDNSGNSVAEIVADGSVTDADDPPAEAIAVTGIDNTGGAWQFSLDNGTTWTAFSTETGGITDISAEARLLDGSLTGDETHRIRFAPDPDWNGTAALTFRAWDKNSGTAGQTADAGTGGSGLAFSSVTDDAGVEVTAVNDSPVLDTDQFPSLTAIDEGDTESEGNTVSEIIVEGSVTDADGPPAEAIAVTSVDNTNGTWQYSVDNGTAWTNLSDDENMLADISSQARLLDETCRIRFVPVSEWHGTSVFTFRAWDKTAGAKGETADASTGGGTSEFSFFTNYASIKVGSVNDAPVLNNTLSPALAAIDEDDIGNNGNSIAEILPDGSVEDIDGSPAEAIAVTAVNNLYGKWQYSTDSGVSWIDFSDQTGDKVYMTGNARLLDEAHRIRFVPDPEWNGTSTFSFRAWDMSDGLAGDTANASVGGGTSAFSSDTDKAEIEVSPVNDAPVLDDTESPALTPIDEDDIENNGNSIAEIVVDGSVTDEDAFPIEAIAVTAVDNTNGKWQYSVDNGLSWTDFSNETGIEADISSQARLLDETHRIRFVPDPEWSGSASLTFRAWDKSSGEAGDTEDAGKGGDISPFSSVTDEADIEVNNLNDAPVLDNTESPELSPISVNNVDSDGNSIGQIVADGSITDADDDAPAEAIAVTAVDNTSGKWQYSLDNGAEWKDFTAETGSIIDISANARLFDGTLTGDETHKIRFVPDEDWFGTATFTFRAWDKSEGTAGETADASEDVDASAFSSATDDAGIEVNLTNIAPVLDDSQSPELSAIESDSFDNDGNTVAEIVADDSITDEDGSPVEAIAVTAVDNTNGKWQYSTDDGAEWTNFTDETGKQADISAAARLLDEIHKIRFVPDQDWTGSATFTFRAWDKSIGTAGEIADAGIGGDMLPFSLATDDASIEVIISNHAPVLDNSQSPVLTAIALDDFDSDGNTVAEIVADGSITDEDGDTMEAIAVTAVDNTNGKWQYSTGIDAWTDFTSETGENIDISAEARLLDESHKIRFVPDQDWEGTATFTFRAWDKSTGTAGETADTQEVGGESAFSSDTDDADIEVRTTNNAPVLDISQSPVLTPIDEDDFENQGNTVAEIFVDDSISDEDGSPVEAMAVTAVDNTNGQWQYSLDGGTTWTGFTGETGGIIDISAQARLLDETGRIRFVPDQGWTGDASFTFRAWDMSSGEPGETEDAGEGGGESAFSDATVDAGIEVNPSNNPPVLDNSFSHVLDPIDEDEDDSENNGNTVAEIVADDSISDEDGPVEAVAVTGLDNTNGKWQFSTDNGQTDNGQIWTDFTSETGTEIDISTQARLLDGTGRIRFVPDPDWSGTSSFTFRAWDMNTGEPGQTADTGEDSDVSAFSIATDNADIEVNPVNDAPVLDNSKSPVLSSIEEDEFDNSGNTVAEIVEDGSVEDIDGTVTESIAVVALDNLNGTWQYSNNGTVWTALEDDLADGAVLLDETYKIRFVPAPGWSGTASFTFKAWDMSTGEPGQTGDPGEGGGETAFSSASDEAVITVNQVNSAPVLDTSFNPELSPILRNNFDTTGDTVAEIVIDGSVTDSDGSPVEAIAVVSAENTNGTWQYSPDGNNWTPFGDNMSAGSVLLDENYWIRFVPDPGWAGRAAFTFRAWDKSSGNPGETTDTSPGGGTSAFSSSIDEAAINVNETNRAPVLDAGQSPLLTAIYENGFDSAGNTVADIVVDGSITDPDDFTTESVAVTGVDNTNGTWQYSVSGTWTDFQDNMSGSHLLLDGTQGIRFVPGYGWNGTSTFTFRAWDKSSGKAGMTTNTDPGGEASAFSSVTDQAAITVKPVNNAPELDNSRYPDLTSITENTFDSKGNYVEEIFVDGSVTDADGLASETMAIIGVDNTNGRWQYSSDNGTSWNNFSTGTGNIDMPEKAVLLSEEYKIRFVPNAGWSGIATFKFRAWDKSDGIAGQQADTGTPGGLSAFSWNADDASIMVISKPVANAGYDQTVEEGSFVKLDASASTGTIATYRWTQTAGEVSITLSDSMGIQPTFTAPDAEPGINLSLGFMLKVQDNNGLESSDSVNITVNNVSAPVASFEADTSVGNVPLETSFKDMSQGNVTEWFWDFGDGFQSMVQNPFHTYASAGTYSVSLTVKGRGGQDTQTINEYITVNMVPLKADFEASPASGTAPLSVSFSSKAEGEITGWLWDFGDGKTTESPGPVHTYENPGTYTVSLTVSGPTGSETETKQDLISIIERNISGRVTAEDTGEGFEDCWVEVWSGDEFLQGLSTDLNGDYLITGLPDIDNLTLVAWPPREILNYYEMYYDGKDSRNQADPVSLIEGNLSDINFVLKKALPYGISGRVHDNENGIADIEVNIFSESIMFSMNTVTGGNGEYSVTGVRPADDYVVSILHGPLNTEFYYAIPEQEVVGEFIPVSSALTENRATFVSPRDPPVPNIDIIVDTSQWGSIEGYVYASDEDNTPIAGVSVNAWSDYLKAGNDAVTDNTGHYIIQGLDEIMPGEAETKGYIIEIRSPGYMYQAYNRADKKEDAVKVTTQSTGIDFYVKTLGSISGTVMNTGGIPVPGTAVTAKSVSDSDQEPGIATSDETGHYTITGLPVADDYIVGAFPSSDYPVQYYNLQPDEKTAQRIDLTYGDASDINFTLDKGGVMKGTVFTGEDGTETAPAGITVNIWSDSTGTGGDVQTDENGRYEIAGLERNTIDYVVSARHTGYVQAFYSHDHTVYKWEDAARIAPSESLDRNIILVTGFSIKGKVAYNDGPVAGIHMEAEATGGTGWGSAVTTGEYELDDELGEFNYVITGLLPGTYNIIIQAEGFRDMIQTVVVESRDTSTGFVLEKEPDRVASGTITGLETGTQVTVRAWSLSRDLSRSAELEGTGEPLDYTITGLKPAEDYVVEIISDDYPYQVFNGKYDLEDADLVDLLEEDASDINFNLVSETAAITGQIIFPGDAVPGDRARIDVFSRATGAESGMEIEVTVIDSQIVPYALTDLIPAHDYIIFVSSDKYINQFYNGDDSGVQKEEDAIFIDVVENPEYAADFRLSAGKSISGRIIDKNEQPVPGIYVEAWSVNADSSGFAITSEQGIYSIGGLSQADDYIVKAWSEDTGSFFYNSKRTVMNEVHAAYVSTVEGNVSDIDIMLVELESISGIVTDLEGFPLHRMWVEANSDLMDTGSGVFTGEDGTYIINGLPSSMDYLVSARPDWYTIPKEKFPVASGSRGVNFTLNPREGHKIQGMVIDSRGNPVPGTRVEAWSDTHGMQGHIWSVTDRSGEYELNGLPPGEDYVIMAWPPEDSDYAFFNEKGHSVPVENDTLNINVEQGLEISGTVTAEDTGLPVKDVQVIAISTEKYFNGKTLTDKNGFYKITNVPEGSDYEITVIGKESYSGRKKLNQYPEDGTDFVLESSGSITGQVRELTGGRPLHNVVVEVYSKSMQGIPGFEGTGITDKNGWYEVKDLRQKDQKGYPLNDYVVTAYSQDYPPQSRGGKKINDNADFSLSQGKENIISGTIMGPDGELVEGVSFIAEVFEQSGDFVTYARAESSGSFQFNILDPAKQYLLKFTAYKEDNIILVQWSGESGNDYDQGIENPDDPDEPPAGAKKYSTDTSVDFRFSSSLDARIGGSTNCQGISARSATPCIPTRSMGTRSRSMGTRSRSMGTRSTKSKTPKFHGNNDFINYPYRHIIFQPVHNSGMGTF